MWYYRKSPLNIVMRMPHLPTNQLSYRKYHSTETALIKVQNDILMDQREVTLLVLLDLSSAFDTVDHNFMFKMLDLDFGVSGEPRT